MKNNNSIAAVCSIFFMMCLMTTPAQALDAEGLFYFGLDFGGDKLLPNITYTDGSSASIDAGEGLYFAGGMTVFLNTRHTLESHITLGWKYTALPDASNGNGDLQRYPVDVLLLQRLGNHRIGGGATYHMNAKLSTSGVISAFEEEYKDALGFVVQYDYMVTESFGIGLRYVDLEYESEQTGLTYDAGSSGIQINASF